MVIGPVDLFAKPVFITDWLQLRDKLNEAMSVSPKT